ncbi:3D domain-containing protein [Bdellovibrio reynosensis]|uniref:3D domain-containing protein n=1 Tax=Bdellovibrio reynosensis TaxID=2835041 RepID=A0ABY4C823_9BACT|nr:3D domain-containing protein [Bdellovibrio reynosensis]UOE99820.1 3D domain-containing protein [Bdellovibrio reynosensis]
MTNAKNSVHTVKVATKLVTKTILASVFVIVAEAGIAPLCSSSTATTSVYFIPHVKDYCQSSQPCAAFRREVRMQGSGILPGNRLLTYNNKTISMGNCETAFGASNQCLIPYISVAADPKYYSMGDIIEMPSLKGKVMTLPNGKSFVHPGYLIVHDKGGAIKGPNRFDLFTGTMGMHDERNSFGTNADVNTIMADVSDCSDRKNFWVTRRGSEQNEMKMAVIHEALEGTSSNSSMQIAMVANSTSGVR